MTADTPNSTTEAGVTDAPEYLCRAWGETEQPSAAIVTSLEAVRSFLVEQWLGSEDDSDLPAIMEELETRDWRAEGAWQVEFEIGGVSVEFVDDVGQSRASAQGGVRVGWVRLDFEGLVFTDKQSTDNWWEGQNYKVHAVQLATPPATTGMKESLAGDAERLDWLQRQDLNDTVFGYVVDAPRDGEYCINAGSGPFYGKDLREAIDAAIRAGRKG